jgi:hypothetical protein
MRNQKKKREEQTKKKEEGWGVTFGPTPQSARGPVD